MQRGERGELIADCAPLRIEPARLAGARSGWWDSGWSRRWGRGWTRQLAGDPGRSAGLAQLAGLGVADAVRLRWGADGGRPAASGDARCLVGDCGGAILGPCPVSVVVSTSPRRRPGGPTDWLWCWLSELWLTELAGLAGLAAATAMDSRPGTLPGKPGGETIPVRRWPAPVSAGGTLGGVALAIVMLLWR